MRVIVTGSRDWEGFSAESRVYMILGRVQDLAHVLGQKLTIVHGDCPTGADACTDRWARRRDGSVELELHPADWAKWGKSAGPARNRHMIDLGADMCIAFLRNDSGGTMGTISLARQFGIPTFVVPWEEAWSVKPQ